MTSAEQEKLRQQLLAVKIQLQSLDKDAADNVIPVELDQAKVGRLSRMDALQGQQMALEAARRRKQQLQLIGSALRRLEEGDYGYCLSCDEEIDIRRLLVDPASTHCIVCAQKLD